MNRLAKWWDLVQTLELFGVDPPPRPRYRTIVDTEDMMFLAYLERACPPNRELTAAEVWPLFIDQPPFHQRWIGNFYRD